MVSFQSPDAVQQGPVGGRVSLTLHLQLKDLEDLRARGRSLYWQTGACDARPLSDAEVLYEAVVLSHEIPDSVEIVGMQVAGLDRFAPAGFAPSASHEDLSTGPLDPASDDVSSVLFARTM